MGRAITLHLEVDQAERLDKLAHRLGKSQDETGVILVEEGLRGDEFPYIEFRDSSIGRQAYMKGSRLPVWQVMLTARGYGMDAEEVARHFQRPINWVHSAFNYYEAFRTEIDTAIADNATTDYHTLKRKLPNLELLEVSLEPLPDELP